MAVVSPCSDGQNGRNPCSAVAPMRRLRPGFGRRLVVMALMLWAAYAPHCIDNGCSNMAVQKLMANCCLKRQCMQSDLNVIV